MSDPDTQRILLFYIERHCLAAGISEREFGYRAVRDYRFVERVRNGKGSLRVITRAEAYLRDHAAEPQPVAA